MSFDSTVLTMTNQSVQKGVSEISAFADALHYAQEAENGVDPNPMD